MSWLNRLPNFTQSAPGLEWTIWKRLPAILLWGTVMPLALGAVAWFAAPGLSGSFDGGDKLLMAYQIIGLVLLHWTLMLTLAIGCVIIMVMKGPAFVADPYPPPSRDC